MKKYEGLTSVHTLATVTKTILETSDNNGDESKVGDYNNFQKEDNYTRHGCESNQEA
ncbi:hypothetical protein DM860_018062 [Cuscuta australis]|uniref:Uncharacterized protein n=1 Tax=Cuscuta australis TaxID=267555 RepID=A0A328DBR1_9ASTE|nr:hypothetical protein DM860_018062 [Cuscuta australis]